MRDASAAFHALALVAAARSALNTARSIADRQSGRDPSAQEPDADARADLAVLADRLAGYAVRLRLRLVTGTPEGEVAALAQAFEDSLVRDDLTAALRRAHQKLLSLYPGVPDALVEEARQLLVAIEREGLDGDAPHVTAPLVRRTTDWLDALHDALRA